MPVRMNAPFVTIMTPCGNLLWVASAREPGRRRRQQTRPRAHLPGDPHLRKSIAKPVELSIEL
jgi:hypothetical protein